MKLSDIFTFPYCKLLPFRHGRRTEYNVIASKYVITICSIHSKDGNTSCLIWDITTDTENLSKLLEQSKITLPEPVPAPKPDSRELSTKRLVEQPLQSGMFSLWGGDSKFNK